MDRVGPAWFTSVMGTGILAICIAISPIAIPAGLFVARGLWSADVVLFASVSALWFVRMVRAPRAAFGSLRDPVASQAWGAPPMAAFTIASGFLLIGTHALPPAMCIAIAQVLFVIGAIGSLASIFIVPYLMITTHELTLEKASGTWLLPVVAPIVASVPAALLSPTWPAALRGSILAGAYALLGMGTIVAAMLIVVFFTRLLIHKLPDAPLVPSMWLVVGPLGQSIAGINALGFAARTVWPAYGAGLAFAAVAYGVLVWGFAVYWLALAIAVTVRAALMRLPFTLGWWAFTFPVGVLTSGTIALYHATEAPVFAGFALALLALLATMWLLVATRTVHNAYTIVRAARGVPQAAAIVSLGGNP